MHLFGWILALIFVFVPDHTKGFPKFEPKLYPISDERESDSKEIHNEVILPETAGDYLGYDPAPNAYIKAFDKFWPQKKVTKRGSNPSDPCKCNCSLTSPVCGRGPNGVLEDFPSQCAMECYQCTHSKKYTLFRRGACPAATPARPTFKPFTNPTRATTRRPSPPAPCKCDCPRGKVLCARDKHGNTQTFGSECALKCFNCTSNEDFRKIKDGDCEGHR